MGWPWWPPSSHGRHGAPPPTPSHTTNSQHATTHVYIVKTRKTILITINLTNMCTTHWWWQLDCRCPHWRRTSFHPVWYTSVPDYPKNDIFSVLPYSTLQLVCNSSKKKLILQTLDCKKCLFFPLKMMAFHYLPSPVEPWWCFPCVWGSITGA